MTWKMVVAVVVIVVVRLSYHGRAKNLAKNERCDAAFVAMEILCSTMETKMAAWCYTNLSSAHMTLSMTSVIDGWHNTVTHKTILKYETKVQQVYNNHFKIDR